MKKELLLILSFTSVGLCLGQQASPEVVASSGDHFSGTNSQLSWTIGEAVIETFSAGGNQLTQGFHQPIVEVMAIEDLDVSFTVKVFPNPVDAKIHVSLLQAKSTYLLEMYHADGTSLLQERMDGNISEIDMSSYPSGVYLLKLKNELKQSVKIFRIVKIK